MARMARISLIVCVLVSISLIGGGAFAQSTQNRRRIVIFQPLTTLTAALTLVQTTQVLGQSSSLVHNLWTLIHALAIELPSDVSQEVEDLLKANKLLVEGVYDDTVAIVDGGSRCVKIVPALGEDVPAPQKYTWNMVTIGVPAVHPARQGSGVKVAVLDTGIASHLELSGPIERYNARYGESSNDDQNGHGTHMAGIIASELNNPAAGVIGVAPQATLLAVKVLDRYGAGYLSDVINGLQWVHNNGSPRAKVVNMSIGFPDDSPPLKKAIHELDKQDVIMVASAGNRCPQPPIQDEGNGDDCDRGPQLACEQTAVKYPAANDEVMAVEATNNLDQTADYSLSGDVAAPGGSKTTGVRILSTTTGGLYGYGSGTSQAAAHVTGAVALALQLRPGISVEEVRCVLQATAQGPRRINVANMVQALLVGHPCLQ